MTAAGWAGAEWTLSFADEFEGNAINSTVWRAASHPNTNGTWDPTAVHVANGYLTITTTLHYTASGVLNASQGMYTFIG